jgi:DNA replication initiation complex subunit (GINS family)
MYDEILNAWKIEKAHEDLQPLPKDFYRRVSMYFKQLAENLRIVDRESVSAELLKSEVEYATMLFTRLYKLRIDKMISKIVKNQEVARSSLTDEEDALIRSLKLFKEESDTIVESILNGREPQIILPEFGNKMTFVRFLKESPAIVGMDLKTYGPFRPEDLAYMPEENAEILEKRGIVAKIKIKMT